VLSHLAEDVEQERSGNGLGNLRHDVVEIFDWYVQRQPDHTAGLLGEICPDTRTRLNLDPRIVGRYIRRSLHFDSTLDRETIDALLDMALPPSAKPSTS